MANGPTVDISDGLVPAQTQQTPIDISDGLVPTAAPEPASTATGGVLDAAKGVATGFAKGVGDTVSGVSHLINKIPGVGETLAPSEGISALDKTDISNGTAEMAGKGLENIAEFAAGDEALEGLSKASKLVALAKKYPQIAEVLNMAKDHPLLAKMITSGGKAAAVGAAQGAIKGAQKDNAVTGAEAGAAGGAVGGPLGEALVGTPEYLLRKFGLGGLTSAEAIIKAGRPNVKEALGGRFADAWVNAKPALLDIPNNTIKTAGDFEDALHQKANDLWTNTIQPAIDKNKNESIDGKAIATAIRKGVDQNVGMRDLFPEQVAPIENMAKHFADTSALSLDKANGYLKTLNAQLKDYYRMSPEARNAAGVTSGRLSSMEDAADAIRDQLYKKVDILEGQPTGTTQAQRIQYGALKDLERVFGKRAVVADRQAPLNLQQVLGMSEAATAMLAGHPLTAAAGAVPFVTKARSTPQSLIRQGLNAAREEATGPSAVSKAANAVVTNATPNLASQAAQAVVPAGMIHVQDSAGAIHELPESALGAATARDPGLKVLRSN